jgi:hypothetical protein
MQFREMIFIYSENHMKIINKLSEIIHIPTRIIACGPTLFKRISLPTDGSN